MRVDSTASLPEHVGLAYREHAFLVDKQSLPHPGLDAESMQIVGLWGFTVALTLAFALWALWRMRRYPAPGPEPSHGGMAPRRRVAWALFAAGLLLRLVGLGVQPADSQELTYLLQVVFPQETVENTWLAGLLTLLGPHMVSPHPPLYRLLLMLVLGDAHNLAWLRFPAALAGAATVPVIYLLGVRLFGPRTGLLAGVLLLLSPFHIYFSQSITPYTLAGLWVALAYLLHEDAIGRGRRWWSYVTVLALGFVTHFSIPALFAPLALDALWRYWRSDREEADRARLWRFVAAGGLSLVPFVVGSLGLFYYRDLVGHLLPMIHAMALFPPVDDIGVAMTEFGVGAVEFLWHGLTSTFATPVWGFVGGVGLALALVGAHASVRERGLTGPLLVTGVVLFITFFLALGCLTILGNGFFYFASRRFIPIVPVLVVLWAGGAWALREGLARRGVPSRVATALIGLLLSVPVALQADHLRAQATEVVKPDMEQLVARLGPKLADGDAIATGPYVFFDFLYSFHADGQIEDWYQAGGAPRWLALEAEAGGEPIDVLVSASDIALPWQQVASHNALRRIWLILIDEEPYGLRELKGPGTTTDEALAQAGLEPCGAAGQGADSAGFEVPGVRVRCFRARPDDSPVDDLRIGDGDYRQVLGFAPPGGVRSHARRLAPSGTLLFGGGAPATGLQLNVMRWFEEPIELSLSITAGDEVQRETVRLGSRKQTVNVPLTLPRAAATGPLRVQIEAPAELVAASPRCFRYRRERFRRGWLDCGIFLRRATLHRGEGP